MYTNYLSINVAFDNIQLTFKLSQMLKCVCLYVDCTNPWGLQSMAETRWKPQMQHRGWTILWTSKPGCPFKWP